ncbi:MAG: tRNA (adenosine(37)-N6)-threonylcarbamoyltransferase complex dimerization subunit type 1 TsaB [Chitinophagaceae bacterium]|nr:tRNA (adenosine(37)-N6)-threonylcarbamoyltransferase complex dimerization subunit type 1 TsaB [Chitinophagaceae bacterium]
MSFILNIDTALDTASVCFAKDEEILALAIHENQKNQAGWLHLVIDEILKKNNLRPHQLDAVAVSIGPGSYTGLRVGLSAAKGLCYALNIPLIAVSTLKMIAFAAKDEADSLICPMIEARRMEVFTAVYDKELQEKMPAHALVIDEKSFADMLTSSILFCGNGSKKLQSLISNNNASFSDTVSNASHLSPLSQNCFLKKEFADLAYTEPLYIKEFYSPVRKT